MNEFFVETAENIWKAKAEIGHHNEHVVPKSDGCVFVKIEEQFEQFFTTTLTKISKISIFWYR